MLDTDMCAYVINERSDALKATFIDHAHEPCIAAIAHAELCK